ncbi:hypothetical protein I6M54_15885 [Shewanella algae]|uniref:Uncharacterized protein n=1 Tax=Shewanella algae TaxID=38313 RepID=A0AAD1KC20_9GAMM|nr:hypothetical protein [Shewanella algae]MBO2596298.1 hypothetical protein [Shewanella algae]MBO2667656.1 hypothetical protein [Shewanella algae]BCV46153.1 hypothetical protein TUM17379_31710 [Shewanella algae]
MHNPKLIPIISKDSGVTPELLSVNYDLWTLRLTLTNDNNQAIYLDFESVEGFRVLDEGQLLEFWSKESPPYWVFEVISGGWLEQEAKRDGAPFLEVGGKLKEYLVAGLNECVSVLAFAEPEIRIQDNT